MGIKLLTRQYLGNGKTRLARARCNIQHGPLAAGKTRRGGSNHLVPGTILMSMLLRQNSIQLSYLAAKVIRRHSSNRSGEKFLVSLNQLAQTEHGREKK
jgi:hypothetical protein